MDATTTAAFASRVSITIHCMVFVRCKTPSTPSHVRCVGFAWPSPCPPLAGEGVHCLLLPFRGRAFASHPLHHFEDPQSSTP
eukprot:scaffold2636_cov340-Pavlova_lutheri.AAC.28